MRTNLSVILMIACCFFPAQTLARNQNQPKLPPGYYIFIGRQPGSSPPKYVIIYEDGTFQWESSSAEGHSVPGLKHSPNQPPAIDHPQPGNQPAALEVRGEFDTYEYPFIKWKPKLLPTGALVQLETTLEEDGSGHRFNGIVKYKVNVLVKGNSLVPSHGIKFELLDNKGFGLCKFSISASELGVITGTSILQARGTANITEENYKKAVDYSVK